MANCRKLLFMASTHLLKSAKVLSGLVQAVLVYAQAHASVYGWRPSRDYS